MQSQAAAGLNSPLKNATSKKHGPQDDKLIRERQQDGEILLKDAYMHALSGVHTL